MTTGIEAFLNSDVGKKAVEAGAQAINENWLTHSDHAPEIAEDVLRAALSSLAEQGAMREAPAFEYGSTWVADTSRPLRPIPMDFPAFILRRE